MGKYHQKDFTIDPSVFQHPADKCATTALRTAPGFQQVLDFINRNSVEKALGTMYRSSKLQLTEEVSPELYDMVQEAMQLFGVTHAPTMFLERKYSVEPVLDGSSNPMIVISTELLRELDEQTAWSWIAGRVAGIRNGYGELRLVELLCRYSGLFLSDAVVISLQLLIAAWKRSSVLSLDRAELIATGDFNITMRSILTGHLPQEILLKTDFTSTKCLYFQQCQEFVKNDSVVFDFVKNANAVLRDDVYLAARYLELWKFYHSEFDDIMEDYT